MNPIFNIRQFPKLRNLKILSKLNLIRILLHQPIKPLRCNLTIMRNPNNLSLKQMLLLPIKNRITLYLRIQLPSKRIFDKS